MASNVVLASSQQPKKGNLISLFASSDQEIRTQICATHVPDDEKFDVDSLFIVVENILKRATLQVADNLVPGTQATVEHLEEKTPKASFSPPLCTLKSISCEMQCKGTGEETAYETTMLILYKLSKYSWAAKAVLTLAAFAMDYGELWVLAQSQSSDSDKVAKSVGTLRRVSVLLKRPRQALIELDTVIKATLEVIGCIFELEKLSKYGTKDVPALSTVIGHIPVDVFWVIVTVVATTTQLCCLTNDDDKQQELSQFSLKLNVIATKLKSQITICSQQIEEIEDYRRLINFFPNATEILDVLKRLINYKDKVQHLIFDGSKEILVNIDELKGKNVLLFISGLDITDEDISILKRVYDLIKNKHDQYKIVWIPIVDQCTKDPQKKFEALRSKMLWYVVPHFSSIGIRFVKEIWHFMGKTSVVVLNPQGRVEHEDAIHMIRLWGIKAFPFTTVVEEDLSNKIDLIHSLATHHDNPNIMNWIQDDQRYIFFYGGNDEWIEQFRNRASVVANDAAIKKAGIIIELACVEKGSKGEDNRGRFWTDIERMFISKTRRTTDSTDSMTGEIWKLLSYKNESGWAILSKGSNVVLIGQGTTILKLVQDFDQWKASVPKKADFEITLIRHHKNVLGTTHICHRIDISNTSGIIPDQNMKCPCCDSIMVKETYISFKYCCHAH